MGRRYRSPASPRRWERLSIVILPAPFRPPTRILPTPLATIQPWSAMPSRPTPIWRWSARWPGWAPARTWFPRASCGSRWPPACRRSASFSPVSARPRRRWRRGSRPASCSSTWSRCPNSRRSTGLRRRAAPGPRPRSESIPTWMRVRTRRSPPAGRKTSSASTWRASGRSPGSQPRCPAYRCRAWRSTSARS